MSILKKLRPRSASPPKAPPPPVETASIPPPPQEQNQHATLEAYAAACSAVTDSASNLNSDLSNLQTLHLRAQSSTAASTSSITNETAALTATISANHKRLVSDLRGLASHPAATTSNFAAHLGRATRAVHATMRRHSELEAAHRQALRAAAERQYRMVRPDADEQEVRAAIDEGNAGQQVFVEAMMRVEERDARVVLRAVEERHVGIARAEKQMQELGELFEMLADNVVVQGITVEEIDEHAAQTKENVEGANDDLVDAVDSAEKARKKKWVCFWIGGEFFVVL